MATEEREFDVIIDCTGFTTTSEIPLLWFKIFLELVPVDLVTRFSRCFILNPNNAAAKFLRKLYHICGGLEFFILVFPLSPSFTGKPLAKKTYAISSIEDLRVNYLDEVTTDALSAGMFLLSRLLDVILRNRSCSREGAVRNPRPRPSKVEAWHEAPYIVVYLHNSPPDLICAYPTRGFEPLLMIPQRRTQTIWPDLPCLLNEIILLTDIGDVYNVSTGQDINEFIIRKSRYGGTLYFSSADRDLIVHVSLPVAD